MELAQFEGLRERLRAVAPYVLPQPTRDRLRYIQITASSTPPYGPYARDPATEPDNEQWRAELGRHITSVRQGLTAAHYHRDHLATFDAAVQAALEEARLWRPRLPTYYSFGAPPMAYEYQAFLFADRRTLEYLAQFVAVFFERSCDNILSLRHDIDGAEPTEARERVRARLERDLGSLPATREGPKTARNQVAHVEALDAGTIGLMGRPDAPPRVVLIRRHSELPGVSSLGQEPPGEAVEGLGLLEAVDEQLNLTETFVCDVLRDVGVLPVDADVAYVIGQFPPEPF